MALASRNLSDEQLIGKLEELGVDYLNSNTLQPSVSEINPEELLIGLIESQNARVRLSLIALLLIHPSIAKHAKSALSKMSSMQRQYFELYYLAAKLLQQKYHKKLALLIGQLELLPYLPTCYQTDSLVEDVDLCLQKVGDHHKRLSGLTLDWSGTYNHVALQIIRQLENEQKWHSTNHFAQTYDLSPKAMSEHLAAVRLLLQRGD